MSTLITFPVNASIGFQNFTLALSRKSVIMRSPFTGKRQTLNSAYALWTFKGKFTTTDTANAALLRSFFAQLRGQANKFKLQIPGINIPQSGYVGATGNVNGASQTGNSLVTNGWSNSTLILKAGDYFTINNTDELKLVTADATSDGSGNLTINFEPAIRTSPTTATALSIGNASIPYVLLASDDDSAASFDVSPPVRYDMVLNATECVE